MRCKPPFGYHRMQVLKTKKTASSFCEGTHLKPCWQMQRSSYLNSLVQDDQALFPHAPAVLLVQLVVLCLGSCALRTSLKNRRMGVSGYGFDIDNERSRHAAELAQMHVLIELCSELRSELWIELDIPNLREWPPLGCSQYCQWNRDASI